MYRIVLFLCVTVCAAGGVMANTIFPYVFEKHVLANGLTVCLIPVESPGLVAYYTIVRTGSRDEVEPGKSGFAHFFEHMMFRGTKKYPGSVYDSIMTSIGASANAYTADDYTAYHINFAKEDLEKVMEMESDRFQNLFYEKQAFQTEAGAVYGEYRKNITSPYALLNEKLQDLAYDVHTYKHTTIGFEADIKAMPEAFEYSKSFFQRYYRPDNVVLLIAGDIDLNTTLGLIARYYSAWERGYNAPSIIPEHPQWGERVGEVRYQGKTLPILTIGYKGDAFDPANKEYVAALLLEELAFGETSELHKRLCIQEQKVEFILGSVPMNRDVPLFRVMAMVKREEEVPYVRDAVYGSITTYQTSLVEEKKLTDLKQREKYAFLMGLDTPSRVAGGLARYVALTGGIEVVNELYARLDQVTPQDIQDAARKYFHPDRRTVVVLKGVQQ